MVDITWTWYLQRSEKSTYHSWRMRKVLCTKLKLISISTSDIYIGTRTVFTPIPRPTRNLPPSISFKEWAFALSEIGTGKLRISFNKATIILIKVLAVCGQHKYCDQQECKADHVIIVNYLYIIIS